MPYAHNGDVRIWWESAGSGPSVLLVHGYTSNLRTHWKASGWVEALARTHRVVAMDVRGHGKSSRPRGPAAYARDHLAADVAAVREAARGDPPVLFGYSMGAVIAVETLLRYPGMFRAAVLGGMGATWPDGTTCESTGTTGRPVRDLQRSVKGLAWWLRYYHPLAMRSLRAGAFHGQQPMPLDRLPAIDVPVLMVVGGRDGFCPGTVAAAEAIPNCRRLVLEGQTHHSTVSDPRFRDAVGAFLAQDAATPVGDEGWR